MKTFQELFYPAAPASPAARRRSQRILLVQGTLASVMHALGTGNFLAGYLNYLGASPAQTARVMVIPQLGCVLQLIAPLFFERKSRRKLSIVCLCFGFRFMMGFAVLAPFLFQGQEARLRFACVLYLISFLLAGFVTPALNQWILQIAPDQGRGRYFAAKNILFAVVNAGTAFLMGRQLDAHTAAGAPLTGFLVINGFCIVGSVVDLALMIMECEDPSPAMPNISLRDLAAPLRDRRFRPLLVYEVLCYCSSMSSMGFLSVYQLNVLGLSHTFITSVGILTSIAGMAAIWVWGRIADRTYWTPVILATHAMSAVCLFGWGLLPSGMARAGALILMLLSAVGGNAAGMSGVNLQYDNCPVEGKTAYLGFTAALASLIGYGASLLGSGVQNHLEGSIGGGPSMSVLFCLSGALSLISLIYGTICLPRVPRQ